MKRTMGAVVVLSALVATSATDIAGQDEVEDRLRLRGTQGVEAVMQMRDRLELTEDQITNLDAIRQESVQRRTAEAAELAEVRSQFAAGQIARSDVMAFMEDRRGSDESVADQQRERIDAILTEAQLESLQEARGRTRAFARGRSGARRGGRSALRGGRSAFRGGRPGMGGGRSGFRRGGSGFRGGRSGFRGDRPGMGGGRRGMRGEQGRATPGRGFRRGIG